jgi:hypothetical protein
MIYTVGAVAFTPTLSNARAIRVLVIGCGPKLPVI